MSKLDNVLALSLAPQILTAKEVLEVTADALIIGAVCHRALTHAGVWNDDGGLFGRAEDVLEQPFALAMGDLDSWLADCKLDGAPRFFNKEKLAAFVREVSRSYSAAFHRAEDSAALDALIAKLKDRDFTALEEHFDGDAFAA